MESVHAQTKPKCGPSLDPKHVIAGQGPYDGQALGKNWTIPGRNERSDNNGVRATTVRVHAKQHSHDFFA